MHGKSAAEMLAENTGTCNETLRLTRSREEFHNVWRVVTEKTSVERKEYDVSVARSSLQYRQDD